MSNCPKWTPCESIQASSEDLTIRYYTDTDKLLIIQRIEKPDGVINRRTTLTGARLRSHPPLVRMLARVVRQWENQLPAEDAEAEQPPEVST